MALTEQEINIHLPCSRWKAGSGYKGGITSGGGGVGGGSVGGGSVGTNVKSTLGGGGGKDGVVAMTGLQCAVVCIVCKRSRVDDVPGCKEGLGGVRRC